MNSDQVHAALRRVYYGPDEVHHFTGDKYEITVEVGHKLRELDDDMLSFTWKGRVTKASRFAGVTCCSVKAERPSWCKCGRPMCEHGRFAGVPGVHAVCPGDEVSFEVDL